MQLDKVVIPAGLLSPARTYSLVRDDSGVFLIYTGRAAGNVAASGPAGAILDKMADKRSVEINANEARLREQGAAALKDTKYSHFLPRASIRAVTIKGGTPPHGWPIVVLEADKKFKLQFHAYDQATVRSFFEPVLPQSR